MTIRKLLLAMVCLVYSLVCFAKTNIPDQKIQTSVNLKLLYNSSLIYAGSQLGNEFPGICPQPSNIYLKYE